MNKKVYEGCRLRKKWIESAKRISDFVFKDKLIDFIASKIYRLTRSIAG